MYGSLRSVYVRARVLVFLGSFGLCACGSGLANLRNKEVWLTLSEGEVTLAIHYYFQDEDKECVTLHGFKGTLNGIPFDLVSAGGPEHGGGFYCGFPRLKFPAGRLPQNSYAKIRISDDSLEEIAIDMPTALELRTLFVASERPGQFHSGEEVVLSWTPETDSTLHEAVSGRFVRSDTNVAVFSSHSAGVIDLVDSQHVRLRVPLPNADAGPLPATGTLFLGTLRPVIDRCAGARCVGDILPYRKEMTMVPQ